MAGIPATPIALLTSTLAITLGKYLASVRSWCRLRDVILATAAVYGVEPRRLLA